MAFLRQFARHVTVLHQGRLLCEGNVNEVVADPQVREVYLGRNHSEVSAEASGDDDSPAVISGGDADDTLYPVAVTRGLP